MYFCPTCANLLMYELPHLGRPARFYCQTCPYVYVLKGKLTRRMRLDKTKPPDPIISDEDAKHLETTQGVTCPHCAQGEAVFAKVQIADDEPIITFYRCTNTNCKRIWEEK